MVHTALNQLLRLLMQLGTRRHKYERKKLFSKSRKITRQIRKIMRTVLTFIYCTRESLSENRIRLKRSYIAFVPFKIATQKCRLSAAPLQMQQSITVQGNRYESVTRIYSKIRIFQTLSNDNTEDRHTHF